MTKAQKTRTDMSVGSTIARSDDGTIQITYQIPSALIKKKEDVVLSELAKEVNIRGFRKGMAPIDKVKESVSKETVIQKILSKILPAALADSINKDNIHPAVYPKFELISAEKDKDWQVRAVTCELPNIDLGDYKQKLTGELRAKSIWIPDEKNSDDKGKSKPSLAEKQQIVIKTLLENIKVDVPKLIIDEEVNSKLSQLLERIEKLGLNLDSYLSSVGKTPQSLRAEYESQAKGAISLELILNKIAKDENISVDEAQIQETIRASAASDKSLEEGLNSPEQKTMIRAVLLRQKALDYLTNLI
jgi:trigger factor